MSGLGGGVSKDFVPDKFLLCIISKLGQCTVHVIPYTHQFNLCKIQLLTTAGTLEVNKTQLLSLHIHACTHVANTYSSVASIHEQRVVSFPLSCCAYAGTDVHCWILYIYV